MNQELRASWVATVINLDWPSKLSASIENTQQRVEMQKAELLHILEESVNIGINTVIFQICPCADALYSSKILPWSSYLTNTLGRDPGFDPLQYAIKQAHCRGIKLHAWINPYRVSMNIEQETIQSLLNSSPDSPSSVFKQHKEWIGIASNRFVLNPGIPEVCNWIGNIVAEVVNNYAVDGIQFDDYFYYESPASKLDDDETYAKYGTGFDNKEDWRRNNTRTLIKKVAESIKSVKSEVQFGISPSGVWRNKKDDPRGSDTQAGLTNYDSAFADTRLWVKENLIDYIVPQIYWTFAFQIASYKVLAKWWSDTVKGTKTKLYIGMALYKVGIESPTEPDWSIAGGVPEIKRQLDLNESDCEIKGSILFRHLFLREPQTQLAVNYIKSVFGKYLIELKQ